MQTAALSCSEEVGVFKGDEKKKNTMTLLLLLINGLKRPSLIGQQVPLSSFD